MTMEPTTCRGLAFLLSLGTLPIACKPEPGDSTDGGTGGTSDATDGQGTTGAPTTSTGTTATDGSATDTAGTGSDDTGSASEICRTYVSIAIGCDPALAEMEADLLQQCEQRRNAIAAIEGPNCLALWDAFFTCEPAGSCDDLGSCDDELDTALGCGPEPGAKCVAYAAKSTECMLETGPDIGGFCQHYINYGIYYGGPACGAAIEELFVCFTALPCADLGTGTGCDAEKMTLSETCNFDDGPLAR
jgi:hypothetical protein